MRMASLIWQDGTSADDVAMAVAVADDGSAIIGGYRENNGSFVALKLEDDGTVLWRWEVRNIF